MKSLTFICCICYIIIGCNNPCKNTLKDHYHYIGKMNYCIAVREVFTENDIIIPDSIWDKIELQYQYKSKLYNYIPYPVK